MRLRQAGLTHICAVGHIERGVEPVERNTRGTRREQEELPLLLARHLAHDHPQPRYALRVLSEGQAALAAVCLAAAPLVYGVCAQLLDVQSGLPVDDPVQLVNSQFRVQQGSPGNNIQETLMKTT